MRVVVAVAVACLAVALCAHSSEALRIKSLGRTDAVAAVERFALELGADPAPAPAPAPASAQTNATQATNATQSKEQHRHKQHHHPPRYADLEKWYWANFKGKADSEKQFAAPDFVDAKEYREKYIAEQGQKYKEHGQKLEYLVKRQQIREKEAQYRSNLTLKGWHDQVTEEQKQKVFYTQHAGIAIAQEESTKLAEAAAKRVERKGQAEHAEKRDQLMQENAAKRQVIMFERSDEEAYKNLKLQHRATLNLLATRQHPDQSKELEAAKAKIEELFGKLKISEAQHKHQEMENKITDRDTMKSQIAKENDQKKLEGGVAADLKERAKHYNETKSLVTDETARTRAQSYMQELLDYVSGQASEHQVKANEQKQKKEYLDKEEGEKKKRNAAWPKTL